MLDLPRVCLGLQSHHHRAMWSRILHVSYRMKEGRSAHTFRGPGIIQDGTDGAGSMLVRALGFHRTKQMTTVSSRGIKYGVIRMATVASIARDIAAGCACPKLSRACALFAAASGFFPTKNPIPTSRTGPNMYRHKACIPTLK